MAGRRPSKGAYAGFWDGGEAVIEIYDLKKTYGKTVALDGMSLKVRKGETVVIMGPSGCGKSTSIRCINRLTEPDSGKILFNGQSILDMSHRELLAYRQQVGFVFQKFNLINRMTVKENVMLAPVLNGLNRSEAESLAERALARVGLSSAAHKRPHEMSGGEQQRVGIARALVNNPQLVLWDEPTASLDPILVREVLEVMEDLVNTTRTTSIIVTHEVDFALRVADRIVLMDGGRVVEEGSPETIFVDPKSEIGDKYKKLIAA